MDQVGDPGPSRPSCLFNLQEEEKPESDVEMLEELPEPVITESDEKSDEEENRFSKILKVYE